MDARLRDLRQEAKKFVEFRCRASALPSWASFPFPNGIRIGDKMEKVGRFDGTQSS
jgi:hypothetical protein